MLVVKDMEGDFCIASFFLYSVFLYYAYHFSWPITVSVFDF